MEMKKENEQLKSIIAHQKVEMYQQKEEMKVEIYKHKEEMTAEILQLKIAMAEMKAERPALSLEGLIRRDNTLSPSGAVKISLGGVQGGGFLGNRSPLDGFQCLQSRSPFGIKRDTAKRDLCYRSKDFL